MPETVQEYIKDLLEKRDHIASAPYGGGFRVVGWLFQDEDEGKKTLNVVLNEIERLQKLKRAPFLLEEGL